MAVKNPFGLYLRSRLNITLAIVCASLAVLCVVFLRAYSLGPVLVIAAVYAGITAALFFSRRGAREIVTESDEDQQNKIKEKIQKYVDIRDSIAVLRVGDERVAKAIEYFLLESGSYLQKCGELGSYSPHANERIERVMEICQVFLSGKDESSTEKRYLTDDVAAGSTSHGADIAAGSSAGDAADPAEEAARAIMDCASVVKDRAVRDLEGLSAAERLRIMQELEGDK